MHANQAIDFGLAALAPVSPPIVLGDQLKRHGHPPQSGCPVRKREEIVVIGSHHYPARVVANAGSGKDSGETSRHGSDSISISLQDTGPGIDPNKLTSIFDPFVTTKANGTGLGLAICKMIIEHHGGKLSAASDMHDGARFEVTLPTNIPAALAPYAGRGQ